MSKMHRLEEDGRGFLEQAEGSQAEGGEGREVMDLKDDGAMDLVGHVEEGSERLRRRRGGGGRQRFAGKLRKHRDYASVGCSASSTKK
jgi:hypothetical protein